MSCGGVAAAMGSRPSASASARGWRRWSRTRPRASARRPSGSLEPPMTTELASVDGKITPTADASVPLKDDGLYRGDGVFEVIYLYGGRPFALKEHLDRLERSAAGIELQVDRA